MQLLAGVLSHWRHLSKASLTVVLRIEEEVEWGGRGRNADYFDPEGVRKAGRLGVRSEKESKGQADTALWQLGEVGSMTRKIVLHGC